MAKIRLSQKEKKNILLYSTRVENLFINEILPEAPGDYVKVYLLGLMYAQFDQGIDSQKVAMQLGLSEKDIDEAGEYWDAAGLIKRHIERDENNEETVCIEFVSLVDELYGGSPDAEPVSGSVRTYGTDAASVTETVSEAETAAENHRKQNETETHKVLIEK